jgi:hypothetical protein
MAPVPTDKKRIWPAAGPALVPSASTAMMANFSVLLVHPIADISSLPWCLSS